MRLHMFTTLNNDLNMWVRNQKYFPKITHIIYKKKKVDIIFGFLVQWKKKYIRRNSIVTARVQLCSYRV